MTRIRRTRRVNPVDAYAWIADVREYTSRIKQGPVTGADLAGQGHINEAAERVVVAMHDLNRALPGHRLTVLFGDVSLPLLTYIEMITVPRAQWATPTVKPILRRKVIPNSARRPRSRR